MNVTMMVVCMVVYAALGFWFGWVLGKESGYKSAKRDFDDEVQETALAKTNRVLHDANRTTLPRHDTTGPAKIHRGVNARKPQHRKKS